MKEYRGTWKVSLLSISIHVPEAKAAKVSVREIVSEKGAKGRTTSLWDKT